MNKKVHRFNQFELYIFRVYMVLFGLGTTILLLMFLFEEKIITVFNEVTGIFIIGFYYIIFNFFITMIHVLRYLFVFRDKDNVLGIKRSLVVIISSPITFMIYFVLTFALALSMASCS